MKKFSKILLLFLFLVAFAFGARAQDLTPPTISVGGAPVGWTNTDATATISCFDGETGCDNTTYRLLINPAVITTCPTNYGLYSFLSPQTISSREWVCGTGKDLAGNISFSTTSVEFKIDKTSPTGTISASPNEVRTGVSFNITASAADNIGLNFACYKKETDTDWTCQGCAAATSCSRSFARSEANLGKYTYFGFISDVAGNSNFTDPDHTLVWVETDPSVATISAEDVQTQQATLRGELTGLGEAPSVEVWFEYGTNLSYGKETSHISKNTTGIFEIPVSGLSPGTDYHFRAVAKNGVGIAYGADKEFTTFLEAVKNGGFETGDLTDWTSKGSGNHLASTDDKHSGSYAGLIGYKTEEIKKDGESILYQDVKVPSAAKDIKLSLWYKFYTTDRCPYDFLNIYLKRPTDNKTLKEYLEWCCSGCVAGNLNTKGWTQITDTFPDSFAGREGRIYFEVENRSDAFHRSWAYIDDISVKYRPIYPPAITTNLATGVEAARAVLNANLTSLGKANSVKVWFEWGTSISYNKKTPPIERTNTGSFAYTIEGLVPDTTYHFRAVAENGAGTVYGSDMTFVTEHAAAGGWLYLLGTGGIGGTIDDPSGDWYYDNRSSDGDEASRALDIADGWSDFLVFNLPYAVLSNKIRVSATGLGSPANMESDVDILYQGGTTWTDIFKGELPINHQFVEFTLPYEGMIIGGRFRMNDFFTTWNPTIDEFQFYKVPDEPITLPVVISLDTTSIEENSAILHGMVTNDGGEINQLRFQYGTTPGVYDKKTPWEGSVATSENFGKSITGLKEGITYYFKAQTRNSVGISSGEEKTFFTQSAKSGWVSPTGFDDPDGKWSDEGYTFDDEMATYTRSLKTTTEQWSSWIYLSHPPIVSDRIRFMAKGKIDGPGDIDSVIVEVNREGSSWINVYSGAFPDRQWVEASFSSGRVDQARLRFHMKKSSDYFYYQLYEFDFWKIAETPAVSTKSATNIETTEATLSGNLSELGGASSVNVWFQSGKSAATLDNNTPSVLKDKPGDFDTTVSGLDPATKYYFRAVASSGPGLIAYGEIMTFTTLGSCAPGQTQDCISDEGCPHQQTCQSGVWPPCPRDECVKNAVDTPDCLCPTDYCADLDGDTYEDDLVNYPDYGDCTSSCGCNVSIAPGGGCAPINSLNDPQCHPPPTASNLISTSPDYCSISPFYTFSWTYNSPSSLNESQFTLEIDNNSDFLTPEVIRDFDELSNPPGTVNTQAVSVIESPGPDQLAYNTTYYWRVQVWDSSNTSSGWTYPVPSTFTTSLHRYPDASFTYTPTRPQKGQAVTFTADPDPVADPDRYSPYTWIWDFNGDGTTDSTGASPQTYVYAATGTYNATLDIIDSSGFSCNSLLGNIKVSARGRWREVIPR